MKYFLTELALFAIAAQFHNAAGIAVAGSKVLARGDTLESTSSTTVLSSSGSTTGTDTPMLDSLLGPLLGDVSNASHNANMTANTASPTGTAAAENPYEDKDGPKVTASSNSTNVLSDCDNCMCLNKNIYEMHQNQDGKDGKNQNQDGQNQNPDVQEKELTSKDAKYVVPLLHVDNNIVRISHV